MFNEPFSDRVFVAVTDNFAQGFIASDTVLIIVLLPQGSILPKFCIDLFGCEFLEGLDQCGQSLFVLELENCVDVVWHDHDAEPFKTFIGFQPIEAFKNDVWRSGSCQERLSAKGSKRDRVICTGCRPSAFTQLAVSFIWILSHIFLPCRSDLLIAPVIFACSMAVACYSCRSDLLIASLYLLYGCRLL